MFLACYPVTDFSSVIALTGLNGHAFGSFKCKDSSYMWLRDDLPVDLPNARVFLWGYSTHGDTFQNINDLGKRLCGDLRILRRGLEVSICHKTFVFINGKSSAESSSCLNDIRCSQSWGPCCQVSEYIFLCFLVFSHQDTGHRDNVRWRR